MFLNRIARPDLAIAQAFGRDKSRPYNCRLIRRGALRHTVSAELLTDDVGKVGRAHAVGAEDIGSRPARGLGNRDIAAQIQAAATCFTEASPNRGTG